VWKQDIQDRDWKHVNPTASPLGLLQELSRNPHTLLALLSTALFVLERGSFTTLMSKDNIQVSVWRHRHEINLSHCTRSKLHWWEIYFCPLTTDALAPMDFEIWYFPITFVAGKVVFLSVQREKWNSITFALLEKYFWLPLENPLLPPPLEKFLPTPMMTPMLQPTTSIEIEHLQPSAPNCHCEN